MTKKTILIWANCQGGSVSYMLHKYYSDLFIIKHAVNYEFIKQNLPIPDEIKNANIFLYQNYGEKKNEYDLKNIMDNYLKKDCIKISFPTLHSCPLLFCCEFNDSNNQKTVNDKYPFGKFYFGMSVIIDLLKTYDYKNCDDNEKTIIIDEIYNTSQSLDFISKEKIEYYYKRSFEFLENKILACDMPELLDFIKQNFTKVRLWHNPNHPTGILLNELVKNIFTKLNLKYNQDDEAKNINDFNNFLNDWVMPIFPSVKKYYNIDFDDYCSSWYHEDIIDTKSYINKYLNDLYLNEN